MVRRADTLKLTEWQARNYKIVASLILLLLYWNFPFNEPNYGFIASTMMAIQLFIICLSCVVLYQIALNVDSVPLLKDPKFIIASVTFLHCLGGVIVLNFHGKLGPELGPLINELTMANLNLIMYPGYSYSFILCQQQRTRSSGLQY